MRVFWGCWVSRVWVVSASALLLHSLGCSGVIPSIVGMEGSLFCCWSWCSWAGCRVTGSWAWWWEAAASAMLPSGPISGLMSPRAAAEAEVGSGRTGMGRGSTQDANPHAHTRDKKGWGGDGEKWGELINHLNLLWLYKMMTKLNIDNWYLSLSLQRFPSAFFRYIT